MLGELLEYVGRALTELAPPGAWRVLGVSTILATLALFGIGLRVTERLSCWRAGPRRSSRSR
jgi:hypothetical protein